MQSPVPLPHVPLPKSPTWLNEFKSFIMRGSVVDLAVGVIIGAAFGKIVTTLVADIFTPIIGVLTGGADFKNKFISLEPAKTINATTLADAQKAGAPTLNFGLFINAIIQFLIVSFAVFWLVKALTRLNVRQDAVALPTKSETLLGEIRDLLRDQAKATPDGTSHPE